MCMFKYIRICVCTNVRVCIDINIAGVRVFVCMGAWVCVWGGEYYPYITDITAVIKTKDPSLPMAYESTNQKVHAPPFSLFKQVRAIADKEVLLSLLQFVFEKPISPRFKERRLALKSNSAGASGTNKI